MLQFSINTDYNAKKIGMEILYMGNIHGEKYRFTKNNTIRNRSTIYFNTPSEWAKENLFYIEMYGHFVCDKHYEIRRGAFDSYLLILTLNGSGTIETPQGITKCQKEDIAVIDCNEEHSYRANENWEFLWLHFNGNKSHEMVRMLIEQQGNVVHVPETSLTSRFFNLIVYQRNMDSIGEEMNISSYIQLFLAEAMNSRWKDGALNPKSIIVNEAIGYIESNYKNKITLADIARFLRCSESGFNHSFRKEMGVSPYEYIIRKRLNKAKELLKTTNASISEISEEVGFNSEANFIKTFRMKNNMTPSAFRNKVLGPVDVENEEGR